MLYAGFRLICDVRLSISTLFLIEHFELTHESFTLVESVKYLADDELYTFELKFILLSPRIEMIRCLFI